MGSMGIFEVHLDPLVVACPFEPFPMSMSIWYKYGNVFAIWSIVHVVTLAANGCLSIVDIIFMVEVIL